MTQNFNINPWGEEEKYKTSLLYLTTPITNSISKTKNGANEN